MNLLVDLEQYSVSLSCWNNQLRHNFNLLTDSWTLFLRIWWYWVEYMRPSTLTRIPVPLLATKAHSMMDPPPNFTVGSRFFSWNAVLFFRHAKHLWLWPNNSILVSFVRRTFMISLCIPQTTLLVGSTQKKLFPASLSCSLSKDVHYQQQDVLEAPWRWSVFDHSNHPLPVRYFFLSSHIFLSQGLFLWPSTIFLTVETEILNLCDNFCILLLVHVNESFIF